MSVITQTTNSEVTIGGNAGQKHFEVLAECDPRERDRRGKPDGYRNPAGEKADGGMKDAR